MPVIGAIQKGGDRYYPRNGVMHISVTSVLDRIPKAGLDKWKKWNLIEWLLSNPTDDKGNLITEGRTAKQILAYYDRLQESTPSSNTGTIAHKYLEDRERPQDVDAEVHSFLDRIDDFIVDYSPKVILSERAMYSNTWLYAGTADIVVEIAGVRYFVDLKTGKSIWPEVALQLSAYRHADYFLSGEEVIPVSSLNADPDKGLVLHVRPDKYELRWVDIGNDTFQTFLSLMDVYHWESSESEGVIREVVPVYE